MTSDQVSLGGAKNSSVEIRNPWYQLADTSRWSNYQVNTETLTVLETTSQRCILVLTRTIRFTQQLALALTLEVLNAIF